MPLTKWESVTSHVHTAQQRHMRKHGYCHSQALERSNAEREAWALTYLGQGLQGAAPKPYMRPATP